MSRREDIDNAIWGDPDFSGLGAHAKLLYLWSFTNPYCGMSGVYKVSERRMAWELGLVEADASVALQELQAAQMLIYADNLVWVRSRVKHLRSRSPQMARSIAKDIEKLPEANPIRVAFLDMYGRQPWLREQLEIMVDEVPSTYINTRTRHAVLERDGYACVDCGATEKLTMDHVTPRSHGGKATIDNLATRCGRCNSRKGVKPNKTGRLREGMDPIDPIEGIDPIHPTEPIEVPGKGQGQGKGSSSSSEKIELPQDFPRELRPHLKAVFRVLRDLAVRHGAEAVAPLALINVVMARSHKPLVRAAYDFAGWADGQAQRRKNVVAGYRNWLDKTNDLAGYEELGEDGLPAAGGPIAGGRENASSMLRDLNSDGLGDVQIIDADVVEAA